MVLSVVSVVRGCRDIVYWAACIVFSLFDLFDSMVNSKIQKIMITRADRLFLQCPKYCYATPELYCNLLATPIASDSPVRCLQNMES